MKYIKPLMIGVAMAVLSSIAPTSPTVAADHTLTAPGLKKFPQSDPRPRAGVNNPGRSTEDVPGQGSPLSGDDTTTPATDTKNKGNVKTPPPVEAGKTAPSQNSKNAP